MELTRKNLRRIILEEIQRMNEGAKKGDLSWEPGEHSPGDVVDYEDGKIGGSILEDSEGEETYHYGEDEGRDDEELHDLIKRHATKAHIDALKRDMDYDEDHEDRRERGTHFREGKISVREAKEITRRIIERIRKEGK